MHSSAPSRNSQVLFQQPGRAFTVSGKTTLSERQKQAISAAFQSTLLSNPHITLELVLQAAER